MSVLYFLFTWVLYIPFLCIVTILVCIGIAISIFIFHRERWAYLLGILWGKLLIRATLSKVVVYGRENIEKNGVYIFVANHQSLLDAPLIYGYLGKEMRWVMKKSISTIPFLGKACKFMGHIFVDRSNAISIAKSLEDMSKAIEKGVSMMLFPEGTRSMKNEIGHFKPGSFAIATELSIPIIPITIEGTYEVFSRNSKFLRGRKIIMTIHSPIETKGICKEGIPLLAKETREIVLSSFHKN
ncbi:MAG TPA: hypothetical protein DDY68_05175 [Porphyromonadaceae bacterium]|nr:hypothetical protein [Porphyromonadaceae bacterium]